MNFYSNELFLKKGKENMRLYTKLENLDDKLVAKLLRLYLERCAFFYSLAFYQYRKTLPECKKFREELEEIFKGRQAWLLKVLDAVENRWKKSQLSLASALM